MLARTDTIVKWALYLAAGFLCLLVQTVFLNRITLWGVIPFLYPLMVAIPATMEGSLFGSAYGLIFGVLCDLLLPAPIPCFYTLALTAVGFSAGLLSRNWLPAGLICSLAAAVVAFFLTDGFHAVVLWAQNHAAWKAAAWVGLREFCVSLPFIFLMTPFFERLYRRLHRDD